ncbi:MAG: hypothetical protein ACFFDN_14900 [Candidatus Hodarchaeota archaeon]
MSEKYLVDSDENYEYQLIYQLKKSKYILLKIYIKKGRINLDECIREVAKSIMEKMGKITGVRVYVSVADHNGNIIYFDSAFENYIDFIKTFVKVNFKYLHKKDHSIPLSSENIIFFKSSDNSMIILYNPKGKIGQLLTFKSIMDNYANSLEECALKIESTPLEEIEKPPLGMPLIQLEVPVFSYKEKLYKNLIPVLKKKIKDQKKFSLDEGIVLNKCDGSQNLFDITKSVELKDTEILDLLYTIVEKKQLFFKDYECLKISCPLCKNFATLFIPEFILDKFEKNLRVQLDPEGCDHTFVAFIDKKIRIKTKIIEKLSKSSDELDISKLSIKNLISFLGEDLFFSIFHAIFIQLKTVFIGDETVIKDITQFFKRIFPQLKYENDIICINQTEFKNNFKKYKDNLVIDFDSHVIIEPNQDDSYDFELKLFKKILKIEDENLQILTTNSEFERLILLTEKILKDIEFFKNISEDVLIKNVETLHGVKLNRYEIPIIKEIANIYYKTDIYKKIIGTVTGQMSGWFDKF